MNEIEEKIRILSAVKEEYWYLERRAETLQGEIENEEKCLKNYVDETFVNGESEEEIGNDWRVGTHRERIENEKEQLKVVNYLMDCVRKKYLN